MRISAQALGGTDTWEKVPRKDIIIIAGLNPTNCVT